MREIKFRQWNENDVFSSNKMDYNPVLECSTGMATMAVDINWLMKKHQSNLMQYTGLKDKNGTEIYEGDILLSASYPSDHMLYNPKKGVAEFYDGSFIFNQNNPRTSARLDVFVNTSIVIGNVFEDGELLNDS